MYTYSHAQAHAIQNPPIELQKHWHRFYRNTDMDSTQTLTWTQKENQHGLFWNTDMDPKGKPTRTLLKQWHGLYWNTDMDSTETLTWTLLEHWHGFYLNTDMDSIETLTWIWKKHWHGLYWNTVMAYTGTLTWTLLKQWHGLYWNTDMESAETRTWILQKLWHGPFGGQTSQHEPPPQPHSFPLNPSLSSPPLPSLPLPLFGGCAGKNREPDDDGPSQVLRRGVRVTNRRTRCGLVSRWTCMPASWLRLTLQCANDGSF